MLFCPYIPCLQATCPLIHMSTCYSKELCSYVTMSTITLSTSNLSTCQLVTRKNLVPMLLCLQLPCLQATRQLLLWVNEVGFGDVIEHLSEELT